MCPEGCGPILAEVAVALLYAKGNKSDYILIDTLVIFFRSLMYLSNHIHHFR